MRRHGCECWIIAHSAWVTRITAYSAPAFSCCFSTV
jgi:hypothetical protein